MEKRISRLAVMQVWGIGDLVMTLPIVAEIARRHPEARLSVIVRGKAQADLLRVSDLDIEVIDMPPISQFLALLRFYLKLRRCRFEMAYIATRTSPLHAVALRVLTGVKTIIGDSSHFSFLYTHHSTIDPKKHRVTRMLDTLSLWDGNECEAPQFPLLVPDAANVDAVRQLQNAGIEPGRFVTIHPGSGRGVGYLEKRLPSTIIHGLIRQISRDFPDINVLLIFGPDDLDLLADFTSLPRRVTALSGARLDTTIAILSKTSAFVGGDTALGHIAAAFGIPTFTVAGPTNIDESRPYAAHSIVISRSKPLPCQPCWNTSLHGRCPHNAACVTSLPIETVYEPLRDRLLGVTSYEAQ